MTIRPTPRLSANELAQYMVAGEQGRIGILKRNKRPKTGPVIRYKDARHALKAFLADPNRSSAPLLTAEEKFNQIIDDPSSRSFYIDDARHSLRIIKQFGTLHNQLGGFSFQAVGERLPNLSANGVEISVNIDLLTFANIRGKDLIGGLIFRMSADDAETEHAKAKRQEMGKIVATLIAMQISQNVKTKATVSNKHCMSADIQHGAIIPAPTSNARRLADIEAACEFISAIWPTI